MPLSPSYFLQTRRFCAAGVAGRAFEIWGTLATHSWLVEGTVEAGRGPLRKEEAGAPAGCGVSTCSFPSSHAGDRPAHSRLANSFTEHLLSACSIRCPPGSVVHRFSH